MSNPTVHIPLEVLSWWYRAAKESIEHYDKTSRYYPPNDALIKKRKEGHEMALKTVEALKGVFEKDIICETEDTNHE